MTPEVSATVLPISIGKKPPSIIKLPKSAHAITRNLDVGKHYGRKCDEVLCHLHRALWDLHVSGTRTSSSVEGYYSKGLVPFVDYMEAQAESLGRDVILADVNLSFIEKYVAHMALMQARRGTEILSFASQRSRFSQLRSLLSRLSKQRILPPIHDLIPANPYPNVAQRTAGERIFSEGERRRLRQALLAELELIRAGRGPSVFSEKIAVYFLLIAEATGRNTIPLLELRRDAMRPHPIKEDRHLFVTEKRRGSSVHSQSFDGNATSSVKSSVFVLFNESLALTEPLLTEADPSHKNLVWLHRHAKGVVALNQQALCRAGSSIVARHGLFHDDGTVMRLTVGALRKTFVNRIWKLSGGDPLVTAKVAGHSISVSNSHYLAVTPEMERNHKFCGIALVESLRGEDDEAKNKERLHIPIANITPTGVSHCSDPKMGKFAPKDGTYCMDFLSCFRCPNQVITGDDLHRLFSFYWLLIRERGSLGANQWGRVYAWVIREIDDIISVKFPVDKVSQEKERARIAPHPMWKDRASLVGET